MKYVRIPRFCLTRWEFDRLTQYWYDKLDPLRHVDPEDA